MNAAMLVCLLAGATDYGPEAPLPDRPPGLPCREECERVSWHTWRVMLSWQSAADGLTNWPDRAPLRAQACRHGDASWAWWHAGTLADPCTDPAERRGARAELLRLIGYSDYLAGRMPAVPD